MDFLRELEKLGLTRNEAQAYIASLKLGPAAAQAIAAKATISRPTAYLMIGLLESKGLMTEKILGKKRVFEAAPPSKLAELTAVFKKEVEAKEKAATRILQAVSNGIIPTESDLSIEIHDGDDSSAQVQADIMKSGADEVLELVNVDEARIWLPPIYPGDIREKIVVKFKNKSLYTHKSGKLIDLKLPDGHRSESRLLPQEKYPIHGCILTYADRVVMTSYLTRKMSTIIRSKELAKTMRTLFMTLWQEGK